MPPWCVMRRCVRIMLLSKSYYYYAGRKKIELLFYRTVRTKLYYFCRVCGLLLSEAMWSEMSILRSYYATVENLLFMLGEKNFVGTVEAVIIYAWRNN